MGKSYTQAMVSECVVSLPTLATSRKFVPTFRSEALCFFLAFVKESSKKLVYVSKDG